MPRGKPVLPRPDRTAMQAVCAEQAFVLTAYLSPLPPEAAAPGTGAAAVAGTEAAAGREAVGGAATGVGAARAAGAGVAAAS